MLMVVHSSTQITRLKTIYVVGPQVIINNYLGTDGLKHGNNIWGAGYQHPTMHC